MHGAVTGQHSNVLWLKHVRCDRFHRDFLPVFPESCAGVPDGFRRIFVYFVEPDNALHFHLVVFQPISVGQQIIAGQANLNIQLRLLHAVCFFVLCNISNKTLQQRGFVTAGCFCVGCDNGLNLSRFQGCKVHLFCFGILGNHCDDPAGRQRGGGRATEDFFIRHDKGGHCGRFQAFRIDLLAFQIFVDVCGYLAGLQGRNVAAGRKLPIGSNHCDDVRRIQAGHIGPIFNLSIFGYICQDPGWLQR